jgi:hypothetical protein
MPLTYYLAGISYDWLKELPLSCIVLHCSYMDFCRAVQRGSEFKKSCYGSASLSAEKKDTGPAVCIAFINGDFRIDIIYTLFAVFSSSHQQSLSSSTLRGSVRGTNRFRSGAGFFIICGLKFFSNLPISSFIYSSPKYCLL